MPRLSPSRRSTPRGRFVSAEASAGVSGMVITRAFTGAGAAGIARWSDGCPAAMVLTSVPIETSVQDAAKMATIALYWRR